MKFEQVKEESGEEFGRLTGIKRSTFDVMIGILSALISILIAKWYQIQSDCGYLQYGVTMINSFRRGLLKKNFRDIL